MAFRGIYPAPELVPAPFGLLSVARVNDNGSDTEWLRGYSFEYDTEPTIDLIGQYGVSSHGMAAHGGIDRWLDVMPFQIQSQDFRSTLGVVGEDRAARVIKQVLASTQKAVEEELADGYTTRLDLSGNQYLADSASCLYARSAPATGVQFVKAISSLEQSISNSPTGEQGVLHLTRSVASMLGAQQGLYRITDPNNQHIETWTGAKVAVGSGYNGNGLVFNTNNKALTSNVATLTTTVAHQLAVGETVTVSGVDATFNGTFIVASVPTTTTFTYAKTAADVTTAVSTGAIQMLGTQSTVWIYATSSVDVQLGDPEVVTTTDAAGYAVSGNKNDILYKALRPASVHFDPSVHFGVKVDLTV